MANLKLTLALPSGNVTAIIDEELLVLNDSGEYVPIPRAKWVSVYDVPASNMAVSMELMGMQRFLTFTPETSQARILSIEVNPSSAGTMTNMELDTAVDPTGGICQCLITCKGTKLSFVKVIQND